MNVSKLSLALLCTVCTVNTIIAKDVADYNILSLDGGGIRGLITATIVDYMETYAYNYSRSEYCIPERAN